MILPDAIAERIGDRRLVLDEDGQSDANVYRVGEGSGDYYLKIGAGTAAGSVAEEAARLAWLDGRLPAARVVVAEEFDGSSWLLTNALSGTSAAAYGRANRHLAPAIARTMAAFLRRLHALPVDACPFDAGVATWLPIVRRLVADGRVDTDDFDPDHADWSGERMLAKVEALAGYACGRVVVHGDFSLGNVILDADGAVVGCIDFGRLGVGDPYRDIVIGWRDIGAFGAEAQRAFVDELGIDALDPARCDLHRALDELF